MNIINDGITINIGEKTLSAMAAGIGKAISSWVGGSVAISATGTVVAIGIVAGGNKCVQYGNSNYNTALGKTVYVGGWALKIFGALFGAASAIVFSANATILTASAALVVFKFMWVPVIILGLTGGLAAASLSAYSFYRAW